MNLSIKEKLNKICDNLNRLIVYPNYGGCGVIAERIYCFLKNYNIDCKIVVFTPDHEHIKEEITNGIPVNGNQVYCRAHVLIKLANGDYVDSYGIEEKTRKICNQYNEIEVPFKFLVWWNLDGSIWNDSFNRNQIPLIDEIVFS